MISILQRILMVEYTVKELVYKHEGAFLPGKAVGVEAVVQYHLTGNESGDYIITIADDKCKVSEGVVDNPVLTMTADGGYFRDVLLGKEDGMKGFMAGKLQLAGDIKLALKLISIFKMS
jgi:putative sterol carrier protein